MQKYKKWFDIQNNIEKSFDADNQIKMQNADYKQQYSKSKGSIPYNMSDQLKAFVINIIMLEKDPYFPDPFCQSNYCN